MNTIRAYDGLNRLTNIASVNPANPAHPIASFSYQYNAANQRARVNLADGSYWLYTYDSLGQVTSGKKYFADDTPVPGQQFEYNFDNIGNRTSTKTNERDSDYTANSLNQYTQRTVPGAVDVLGSAATDATVTVNNESVVRKGEYFYKELAIANTVSAAYPSLDIVGVKTNVGPNGEDAVTEETGHLFVPRTPEPFTYDSDGNLTSDGRWTNTWDAENRLVSMQTVAGLGEAVPKQRLEFAYDFQGRRIQKKVFAWNSGSSSWLLTSDSSFLYNDWNLIRETQVSGLSAQVSLFIWGLDLSGSIQGAGGVGGFLMAQNASDSTTHFPAFDGNGNVMALVNADTGAVSAEMEYGPFGEPLRATGAIAKANPFRFSTKYTDQETGLLYYGYRFYSPNLGRWISAGTSLMERGGWYTSLRLYANNPINKVDYKRFVYGIHSTKCIANCYLTGITRRERPNQTSITRTSR